MKSTRKRTPNPPWLLNPMHWALAVALVVVAVAMFFILNRPQSTGGWIEDFELAKNASGVRCAFQRVAAGSLTRGDFEKLYRGRVPVVFTGLLTDWPAHKEWTRPNLLSKYGKRMLKVKHQLYAVATAPDSLETDIDA